MRTVWILLTVGLLAAGATAVAAPGSSSEKPEKLRCANLIYAVSKTSRCFSEKFLSTVAQQTNCNPDLKFTAVKLAGETVYQFPFAIMTGEGAFTLTASERLVLKSYLTRGGFLLASAGCSSTSWDRSFRQEIQRIFPKNRLQRIPMNHAIFHTVYDVTSVRLKKGGNAFLEGLVIDDKIVLVYSAEGLNDTANATQEGGKRCCCCGGNEISNSQEINVNIFTYALTH